MCHIPRNRWVMGVLLCAGCVLPVGVQAAAWGSIRANNHSAGHEVRGGSESFGVSDKSVKAKQTSHPRSKQPSHCGANVIIQENIMAQPHNHLYHVAQHGTEGTLILLEILTVAAMLLRMKYNDRHELRHI